MLSSFRSRGRALTALGALSLMACGGAADVRTESVAASEGALVTPIIPTVPPISVLFPTYTGKIPKSDGIPRATSETGTATAHVPLGASGKVSRATIEIELDAARLKTDDADIVVPSTLTGGFDEVSIALITPSGRQVRLTDPISLRRPNGDAIEPLRVSSIPRLRAFTSSETVEIYRPKVDASGLPILDASGKDTVQSVACTGASWLQDSRLTGRVFPRCAAATTAQFKSTIGSDLRFATKTMKIDVKDLNDEQAYGDWTLVVTDARPLKHDAYGRVDAVGEQVAHPIEHMVSRFAIKSFKMTPFTGFAPLEGSPRGARAFENEPTKTGPIKRALVGASDLVASGIRLDKAKVWFRTRYVGPRVPHLPAPIAGHEPRVLLRSPGGKQTTLQVGFDDGGFYERALGSGGRPFPEGTEGEPIDGTWKLIVNAWDPASSGWKDASDLYTLQWGIKAEGPVTDYVAVNELAAPVVLEDEGTQSFDFDVQAGDKVARDLWLELGTDNMWAFRHRFTVTPPSGRAADAIHSCTTNQTPKVHHCLRVESSGKTVRIELPRPTPMTGTWRVKWQVDRDPAGAATDLQVEMAGCTPVVSSANASQIAIAVAMKAQDLRIYHLKLGLGETRMTDALFAHTVLDAAEARPREATTLEGGKRYTYNIERVRLNRDFWSSYGKANDAVATASASYVALSHDLDTALQSDNLRTYSAIEDGMFAAWAPDGNLDRFANGLGALRRASPLSSSLRLRNADMALRLVPRGPGLFSTGPGESLPERMVSWIDSVNDGSGWGAVKATVMTVALAYPIAVATVWTELSHGGPGGVLIQSTVEARERREAEKTEKSNAKADPTTPDGSTKETDPKPDPSDDDDDNGDNGGSSDEPDENEENQTHSEMCPDYAYECSESSIPPHVSELVMRLEHLFHFMRMRTMAPMAFCADGPCGSTVATPVYQPPGIPVLIDRTSPYVNCGAGAVCGESAPVGSSAVCLDWIHLGGVFDPMPFTQIPGIPIH
jgi:hypothetical protein